MRWTIRGRLTLAMLALCPLGCSLVLDDYRVGEQDEPGDAARDIPILPMIPDEGRMVDCETCAAEKCSELREVCVGEPSCLQMLRCKGQCSDPDCILACDDRYPESRDYDDYRACVLGPACADADLCNSGRNFGCAGRWVWTTGDVEFDVNLTVMKFNAGATVGTERAAGAHVRVCTSLPCEGYNWRAEGNTDGAGQVTLPYRRLPGSTNDLYGFVEVSGTPERDRYLDYSAPFLRNARRTIRGMSRRTRLYDAVTAALVTDDSRPVVWAWAVDCLLRPASDLEIRIEQADAQTVRVIEYNSVDLDLTNVSGRAGFFNVPVPDAGGIRVTAFRLAEDLSIASNVARVQYDWWTNVMVFPFQRNEGRIKR